MGVISRGCSDFSVQENMASWDDLFGKNSFEFISHLSGCFGASKGIPGAFFTFAELAGFTNSADRTLRPVPPPVAK